MTKSILEIQAEVKAEFSNLVDKDDKWAKLIKLSRELPEIPAEKKEDKFLISGCASKLYLIPSFSEGKLHLEVDVDRGPDTPTFVRGLGAIAVKIFGSQSPNDILQSFKESPEFFKEIGLTTSLSATRANGFGSLLKQIFMYAQVYARLAK